MEISIQNMENYEISTMPFSTITLPPDKLSPLLKTIAGEELQIINLDDFQNQQVIIISNDNDLIIQKDINSMNTTTDVLETANTENVSLPATAGASTKVKTVNRKERTIKCLLCQKSFENLSRYRFHMKKHQSPKKYHCNFCPQSYNKEVNYKIHMTLHESGPQKCPICERRFQRYASLKAHLVVHSVEESYSCLYCKAEYDKEYELYKHLEVHEVEETDISQQEVPLQCTHCNYVFNDVGKYKKHLQLHTQARKIVNGGRNRSKRRGRTREFAHKCQDCSKSFPKRCLLERHKRTHTGEKPFICTICKRGFSQKSALSIHRKRHEGVKAYECMFCAAKFVQKGNLIAHLQKTHSSSEPDEKVYKCTHCTCVFKKISSLNGHVTRVHSDCTKEDDAIMNVISQLKELGKQSSTALNETPKQIPEYKNNNTSEDRPKTPEFSYVKIADSSVNGHLKTYLIKQRVVGEHRLYMCSDCNKEFKKPSDLIRHIRIHTKEKPYKCPECDLKFAQKSTVNNHLATHRKNEFMCVVCKKNFGSIRSLNVHLKKHDQSAIARKSHCYKCSECDKTFDTLDAAALHIPLHEAPDESFLLAETKQQATPAKINLLQPLMETSEGLFPVPPPKPKIPLATLDEYKNRPFKCHTCNAAFGRAAYLKKHVAVHSPKKEFTCSICSKRFGTRAALKEHFSYHKRPRTHICTECNKGFINASMLKRHTISHKSALLYVCPYCKKRFRAKDHCRKHIARHNITASIQNTEDQHDININDESLQLSSQGVISLNSLIDNNLGNVYTLQNSELVVENFKEQTPTLDNVAIINDTNIPQLHIQEGRQWLYNLDDIQLLSNVENGLEQQIKLQNTDDILLNPELQTTTNYDLSASNIVLGLDGQISIDNETFQSNMLFNTTYNDLENVASISKDQQFTTDVIGTQEQPPEINVAVVNDIVPKDINYFDISIRDLLDVRPSNLPQEEAVNSETSIFVCTTCNGKINSLDEEHICPIEDTELLKDSDNIVIGNLTSNDENCGAANVPDKMFNVLLSCPDCPKQFTDAHRLNSHISAKHKRFADHSCQFCKKVFKKKSDMDRHVRTHTGEKPFACSKCDKSFAIKSTLMSHLRTHNPTDFKPFQCQVCSYRFSTSKSLKMHLQTHGDKQQFRCSLCSKTFKRRHHMAAHMAWHENTTKTATAPKMSAVNLLQSCLLYTNDKIHEEQQEIVDIGPVEDVQAENMFPQEFTIQIDYNSPLSFKIEDNMLVPSKRTEYLLSTSDLDQTKEKKFQCEICLKNYVSNSVLRKHMRVLHGDYKCDKCNRAFNSVELLEKHYITHDGHRPFNCNLCTNSFFTQASLKVHLKRMHVSL